MGYNSKKRFDGVTIFLYNGVDILGNKFWEFLGGNMNLNKDEMKEVLKQVDDFLVSHMIELTPPVDVFDIATRLGFKIGIINSNEFDGYIITDENANKIFGVSTKRLIGVNEDLDVAMRRFIVAHEFGHFQMNANGKSVYAHRESRKGKGKEEQRADFFAANIIMPKAEFVECVNITIDELKCGYEKGIFILGEFFGAPIESVKRRIEEIDELYSLDLGQRLKNSGA